MNIKNWIYSNFLTKSSKTNKKPDSKIVCSKLINVTHCNTENRQKVIKKLIEQDDLFDTENPNNEPLSCSPEIDEYKSLSGRKMLKVIVLLDDYICDLGYIPREFENELNAALNNSDNYYTNLFVTKKNNIYYLKIQITFTKKE